MTEWKKLQEVEDYIWDTHQGKSVRDFMKNEIDDAADITDDVKKH